MIDHWGEEILVQKAKDLPVRRNGAEWQKTPASTDLHIFWCKLENFLAQRLWGSVQSLFKRNELQLRGFATCANESLSVKLKWRQVAQNKGSWALNGSYQIPSPLP